MIGAGSGLTLLLLAFCALVGLAVLAIPFLLLRLDSELERQTALLRAIERQLAGDGREGGGSDPE